MSKFCLIFSLTLTVKVKDTCTLKSRKGVCWAQMMLVIVVLVAVRPLLGPVMGMAVKCSG